MQSPAMIMLKREDGEMNDQSGPAARRGGKTGGETGRTTGRKTSSYKLSLLYTMKYLLEESDEEHAVNASDIAAYLKTLGLTADRRTIYSDVAALREFGLDILTKETGNTGGYYIGSREFELPELGLLVDAVQSSRFMTVKKSESLIRKISMLTSKGNAKLLKREVFLYDRNKAENENILYNVDSIYEAMRNDLQIVFQYAEYTPQKKLVPRHGGARYQVSPWGVTWNDGNYYLVSYDDMADKIKHYRVDKMLKTRVTGERRVGNAKYAHYDMAALARKTFGMFGGEDCEVSFLCANRLAGVVIDRFGADVAMIPADHETFRFQTTISISPQFYGWVTAIGPGMKITGPEQVRQAYRKYLKEILEESRR